jgi:HSP20 family protein
MASVGAGEATAAHDFRSRWFSTMRSGSDPRRMRAEGRWHMAIVKWTPFSELDSMERRMRRLFEEIGFAPALAPAADVYETDDEFVVELEVPGYDEKELSIEVYDHMLSIKGARAKAKEETTKDYALHERLEREFERRFVLPTEADTEHLKARFAKGVLEVHAGKLQTPKPKKVAITKS